MPGQDILTTDLLDGFVSEPGTSVAAPHITALAAIARAHAPHMSESDFRDLLRNSAIPRGNPTHDADNQRVRNNQYGYGIVDVGLFMYNLASRDFFNFNDTLPNIHVPYAWRHSINEAARWGLMHGRTLHYTSNRQVPLGLQNSFHPHAAMWRLEFPMALGRLYELRGRHIPWVWSMFSDVNLDALFPFNYPRYVAWAYSRGIVHGVGDNLFDPGGGGGHALPLHKTPRTDMR